jgi:hypothetical protein
MKKQVFILTVWLGGGAGPVFASGPATPQTDSRISVVFVDPQKFTDLKQEEGDVSSPSLLDQLQKFMCRTGERYVPAGLRLEIRVTDIDLAGQFEPWRGPEFDHVRIVKSLYPPRIRLEFSLSDAQGNVVRSGQRELTDLAFQMRDAFARPSGDYLRYEKDLLRDWFEHEFRSIKVAGN